MNSFNFTEDGNKLINGEIEEDKYILTQIKHLHTQSVIGRERLEAICEYLLRELECGKGEHFITINDQIPLRLSNMEMRQLVDELMEIQGKLK